MPQITCENLLRVGDRVVADRSPEARRLDKASIPDGTLGTVVGFERREEWVCRVHLGGQRPGKYLRNGTAAVRWDDDTITYPGANALAWLNHTEALFDSRRYDIASINEFERWEFVADLPSAVPIWEHDIVRVRKPAMQQELGAELLFVDKIYWRNFGLVRDDNSPMPLYQCGVPRAGDSKITSLKKASTTELSDVDVELHQRGHVYEWMNGDRTALTFSSLEEEVYLNVVLGLRTQVRNPWDGSYQWPAEAKVEAARRGWIDSMTVHWPGTENQMAFAYHYLDRDLSERMRRRLLAEAGVEVPQNTAARL